MGTCLVGDSRHKQYINDHLSYVTEGKEGREGKERKGEKERGRGRKGRKEGRKRLEGNMSIVVVSLVSG